MMQGAQVSLPKKLNMAILEPKDASKNITRQGRICEACFMLIKMHMSDLQALESGGLSLEDLAYIRHIYTNAKVSITFIL